MKKAKTIITTLLISSFSLVFANFGSVFWCEIIQIIEDYKSNCTDSKSGITFANTKVVFEKVSKAQALFP